MFSYAISDEDLRALAQGASLFTVMEPRTDLDSLALPQDPYLECLPMNYLFMMDSAVWGMTGHRGSLFSGQSVDGAMTAFAYTNTAPVYAVLRHQSFAESLRSGSVSARVMHLRMYERFQFTVRDDMELLWTSTHHDPVETDAVRAAIQSGARLKAVLVLPDGLTVQAPVHIPYYRTGSGHFDISTVPDLAPQFFVQSQTLVSELHAVHPELLNPDSLSDRGLTLSAPSMPVSFDMFSDGTYADPGMKQSGTRSAYLSFSLYAHKPSRQSRQTHRINS